MYRLLLSTLSERALEQMLHNNVRVDTGAKGGANEQQRPLRRPLPAWHEELSLCAAAQAAGRPIQDSSMGSLVDRAPSELTHHAELERWWLGMGRVDVGNNSLRISDPRGRPAAVTSRSVDTTACPRSVESLHTHLPISTSSLAGYGRLSCAYDSLS